MSQDVLARDLTLATSLSPEGFLGDGRTMPS